MVAETDVQAEHPTSASPFLPSFLPSLSTLLIIHTALHETKEMRIKLEANTGPNDTLIRREKERYLDAIL
jgi:hypothetical protein